LRDGHEVPIDEGEATLNAMAIKLKDAAKVAYVAKMGSRADMDGATPVIDKARSSEIELRLTELDEVEKHLALSKMRYTPGGLRRWLDVLRGGQRKR
jgi:hypothetical protein